MVLCRGSPYATGASVSVNRRIRAGLGDVSVPSQLQDSEYEN